MHFPLFPGDKVDLRRSALIWYASVLTWLALQKWHDVAFLQVQDIPSMFWRPGNRRTSLAQDRMQLWYRMPIFHGHFIVLPRVHLPREWCCSLLPPGRTAPRITGKGWRTCLGRDLGKFPLFLKIKYCINHWFSAASKVFNHQLLLSLQCSYKNCSTFSFHTMDIPAKEKNVFLPLVLN